MIDKNILTISKLLANSDFTTDQKNVINMLLDNSIDDFKNKNMFVISGKSGVGKTFTMSMMIKILNISGYKCMVGTFTGKASQVLREKGINSQTIHSIMYKPIQNSLGQIIDWEKNEDIECDIFFIDEYSMLSEDIINDILDYNKITIFFGDNKQLPPIGKNTLYLEDKTDFSINQIVRQAEGNPIIKWANYVRDGNFLKSGIFEKTEQGIFATIDKKDISKIEKIKTKCDQIICGTNKNRHMLNKEYRSRNSYDKPLVENESLVVLKNDKHLGVFNGQIFTINKILSKPYKDQAGFLVQDVENDIEKITICVNGLYNSNFDFQKFIYENRIKSSEDYKLPAFIDYSYALTSHKCLTDDTYIYTNKGIRQLKDINNNVKIGHFEKIDDIEVFDGENMCDNIKFLNNGFNKINIVKTEGNFELKITDEHKIYTVDKNLNIIEKFAKNLKDDDFLLQRINQNIYQNNVHLNLNYPKIDIRAKKYNIPKILNKNISKLLGYIVADGYISKRTISFGKKNAEVVKDYLNILKKEFLYLNDNINYLEKSNMYIHYCNSVFIVDILLQIGGMSPKNKYIPNCILESNLENQIYFLSGLFEDGSVNLKNNKFDHIEFTSNEKHLIMQVSMLLLNMGIKNSIYKYKNKNIYKLFIYRSESVKLCNLGFHFTSIYKIKNLEVCKYSENLDSFRTIYNSGDCFRTFIKKNKIKDKKFQNLFCNQKDATYNLTKYFLNNYTKYSNTCFYKKIKFIYENYNFLKIKDISISYENTYCLDVPSNHKFIQNGFLGGNCQGSQYKNVLVYANDLWFMYYNAPDKEIGKDLYLRAIYTAITRAEKNCFVII